MLVVDRCFALSRRVLGAQGKAKEYKGIFLNYNMRRKNYIAEFAVVELAHELLSCRKEMMEDGDEVGRFVYFWVVMHGLVDNGTHAPRFPIEKGRTALQRLKNGFGFNIRTYLLIVGFLDIGL